jgi:SNF2 family DNA or RNA helicase
MYTKFGIIRFMNEQGASNLDELREKISDSFLRRKKAEVLDLPEKVVGIQECEMTKDWKKTYDTAWDAYLDFLEKNPIPEKNIDNIIMARHLVEIQKLKQVCSQSKIERICADIEAAIEADEKVIIFTQYTRTLDELAARATEIKYDTGKLDYFGKPLLKNIKVVTLSGKDKMAERQKSVDDFQNEENVKVFVANIKAGGVGLNLTGASIVMFADMDWSPEIHRQAEDRAHRIGQKEMVNIFYYVCPGTIEDDIIEILNSKKNVADKILEGGNDDEEGGTVQREFLKRLKKKVGDGRAIDKVV